MPLIEGAVNVRLAVPVLVSVTLRVAVVLVGTVPNARGEGENETDGLPAVTRTYAPIDCAPPVGLTTESKSVAGKQFAIPPDAQVLTPEFDARVPVLRW